MKHHLLRVSLVGAVLAMAGCFPELPPDAGNVTRPQARIEAPTTGVPGSLPEGRSSCADFENAVILPAECG